MTDDRPPPSLEEIEARLRTARRTAGSDASEAGHGTDGGRDRAMGAGVRIGVELVAGVLVGVGSGLLIDNWLGTGPWGLIVMFFLGSAAGFLNVYRATTGEGYAVGYKDDESGKGPAGGPDDKGQDRGRSA